MSQDKPLYLAGAIFSPTKNNIHFVRQLTPTEKDDIRRYMALMADARNRFELFNILVLNFQSWEQMIATLKTTTPTREDKINLDRHMMNFLCSARAVLDQFKQYWVQQFRNTPEEKDFENYFARLAQTKWEFAFFQDYRNFAQHCGLPICNFERKDTETGFVVTIQADAEWLTKVYKMWGLSKLQRGQGRFDLVGLTKEYFNILCGDVGLFLADGLIPKLIDAHNFCAELADEVRQQSPEHKMILIPHAQKEDDKLDLTFIEPPSNFLGEIGIGFNPVETSDPPPESTTPNTER